MDYTGSNQVTAVPEVLARQFEFARDSTIRLLGEFDEETARWRPTPHNNNALWLAGHLLISGNEFREMLAWPACEECPELDTDFGMGGFFHEDKEYASFAEIAQALLAERDALVGFIRGMSGEDLVKPTVGPLADFCPHHADLVSLMIAHENIHNGQLYFLRRGLGKEPLIK